MGAGHASTSIGYAVGLKEAMRHGIGEDGKVVAVIGDGALTGGRRVRGAAQRRRPADADRDRPQRQRDVDLAQRRRDRALVPAPARQPAPLPRPRGGRVARWPSCRSASATGSGESGRRSSRRSRPTRRPACSSRSSTSPTWGRSTATTSAALRSNLEAAFEADRPVVVHIHTVKGKGFEPAEEGGLEGMEKWHAAKPGSIVAGKPAPKKPAAKPPLTRGEMSEGARPAEPEAPSRRPRTRQCSATRS